VEEITRRAREFVFEAIENGWTGPPYDPFKLAKLRHIEVRAISDVRDARTISSGSGRFLIEYNPTVPETRMRFSICHEIAHTFFPDCSETVRHRNSWHEDRNDAWQLEMLCNIAAAELLMPIGSFEQVVTTAPSLVDLLHSRSSFRVSTEAILLRFAKLTQVPCFAFAARHNASGVQLEYGVPSRSCDKRLPSGLMLPKGTVLEHGSRSKIPLKNNEVWPAVGRVSVECVGLRPHRNDPNPRIVGLAVLENPVAFRNNSVNYVIGDATEPYGAGKRIIAHIVNDRSFIWGAGFGRAIRKKWPKAQSGFSEWVSSNRSQFRLGELCMFRVDNELSIAHMIAQHGFGPSRNPRIRYDALRQCLDRVGQFAIRERASLHMPRIGCGEAGGVWSIVHELIEETLLPYNLSVSVYDLPSKIAKGGLQQSLFGR
jgi:hypothetical protein